MEYTTNLNLKKPGYSDTADIQDISDNMDILDAEIPKKVDKVDGIIQNLVANKYLYLGDYDDNTTTKGTTGLRCYVRDGVWNITKNTEETHDLGIRLNGNTMWHSGNLRMSDLGFKGFNKSLCRHESLESVDINTIVENSIYNIHGCTNTPIEVGTGWAFLHTMVHSNSTTHASQICYGMNGIKQLWFRYKKDNVWDSWNKIWHSGNSLLAGTVIICAFSTPPTGYLECNGVEISRSTYSALYNAIGTTYGVGNGSTTFNIPDLRGQFIRGWDHGRGKDTDRAFGSDQEATPLNRQLETGFNGAYGYPGDENYDVHPTNVALMYCIKY